MRLLGVAVLAWLLACGHAIAEPRLALLIGNSRYESILPLRNPENDVGVVATSLKAVGFETITAVNLGNRELRKAVDNFVARAGAAGERPTVLIYYAGHGIQRGGKNYLLPVDFAVDELGDLSTTALELDEVLSVLARVDANVRMVVLDACRNDPFEQTDRGAVPLARGFSGVKQASGQLVAFSTSPGKSASDGSTGTSPYASAFAEIVLVPGLDLRQSFDRVRAKVIERTKGLQEPWESSALYGEFRFIPATQDAAVSELEALLWDNVALLDSAEAYQRYIDRFPTGLYAVLARQKIENINRDFAFRKQTETFPIISSIDGSLDFCWENAQKRNRPSAHYQLLGLRHYRGELVYVDLEVPLRNLMCKGDSEDIRLTAYSGSAGSCSTMINIELGLADSRKANLECDPAPDPDTLDFFAKDAEHGIGKAGGLVIATNGDDFAIAAGNHNFFDYTFFEMEGYLQNSALKVRGLVRVHVELVEEMISLEFEPVDPATLGLSWKYQNTLEAFRGGGDTGARFVSLADEARELEKTLDTEPQEAEMAAAKPQDPTPEEREPFDDLV
jgi:hypothetical protein